MARKTPRRHPGFNLSPMRAVFVLLLALAALLVFGARHLPPAWDPGAPLDLRATPNAVTPLKLRRLAADPAMCRAAFAVSGIPLAEVPDRPLRDGCGWEGAVRLPAAPVAARPEGPVVTCRLAAAWVLWTRHEVGPAAERHLGAPVAAARHLGSYNCRAVRGTGEGGPRSEHATANALDVAAFLLADGREVSVLRHWGAGGTAEGAFLRAARDGACRWFRVTLGPDRDAAHRDHFHLDTGPARACR